MKIKLKELQKSSALVHSVLAVEMASGCPHATFWILGPDFESRIADGIHFPDVVPACDCTVVDGTIPNDWVLASWQFSSGTRTILAPHAFCQRGFLEDLSNGDAHAVANFVKVISK